MKRNIRVVRLNTNESIPVPDAVLALEDAMRNLMAAHPDVDFTNAEGEIQRFIESAVHLDFIRVKTAKFDVTLDVHPQPRTSVALIIELVRIVSFFLDRETREDVFTPAYEDMRAELFRSLEFKNDRECRWIKWAFRFKLALMVCDCFLNMVKTRAVDFIAPISRAFRLPGPGASGDE